MNDGRIGHGHVAENPGQSVKALIVAHLIDDSTSVVFTSDGGMPTIAHWGAPLGQDPVDPAIFERPVANGGLDVDAPLGLVAEASRGTFARPGIEGRRAAGRDFAPRFALDSVTADLRHAAFELVDEVAQLRLRLTVALDACGVLTCDGELTNEGDEPYELDSLRFTFPLPDVAGELITLGGRHGHELLVHRTPWGRQCVTIENRHGKTSHEHLGAVIAGTAGFSEHAGEVWTCHVGWSGNYELVCDGVTDGRRSIQAGELLLAGEVSISPGGFYRAPTLYLVYSSDGLQSMSQRFHRYIRSRPGHPRRPRPVTLNTWEAVYFDHDIDRLSRLADVAASVGIERFVLDDGWFHLRRNDRAGLGDWWVDPAVWPEGLGPIVNHVRGLGMEFGLWFEPEMINPDSALYRDHPDWVLTDQRYAPVLGRNQLVLDIGRPEVCDHLFERINAVLEAYDIAYVKWDHNRDLVAPTSHGRASVRAQVLGLYDLLDRLRVMHPTVEFESCASGGGRIDLGILARTDRVWTSDSIDALDRQAIQRGFSLLFPPELMGSHIGSPKCHTTGRRHTLAFRASTALFGHLGVEWNIAAATDAERSELAAAIALHKELRPLLHTGDVFRGDHPDPAMNVHGVVAADRSSAIIAVVRLASSATHHTAPVRIRGLEPGAIYTVRLDELGRRHLAVSRTRPSWVDGRLRATGRHLALHGVNLPVLNAESSVLLRIERAE